MPSLDRPLTNTKFTLDVSGIAGFFGGPEALAAITTIHLFKGKRWLGWYNMPGSYFIARTIGQLANSGVWDRLFPRPDGVALAEFSFGLDGKPGPKYVASVSGTVIQNTGYLGYLTMMGSKKGQLVKIAGRSTIPSDVAFLDLRDSDSSWYHAILQEDVAHTLLALIPILTSFTTCVLCALFSDWFCFAMILLGIVSCGLTSFVIGSAKLAIQRVRSARGAPPGDGLLIETNAIVVVRGDQSAVNTITRGRFSLTLVGSPHYNRVGMCSLLLITQFLLQLLLIPQGSLFGQIMFVISIAVSWIYSYYLSTFPKEEIHLKWLLRFLGNPKIHRFRLGTRTTMAVFTCLVLCGGASYPVDARRLLREFIPNETLVWQRWRDKVAQQLESGEYKSLNLQPDDSTELSDLDMRLLTTLLMDAESAFQGYMAWRESR
ncbi:hypothetical protein BS17DRAFT_511609 [Gyrodon lividus]|nr:hypothetical protein BS17DRAFT_511609 [Gyrodon lividus]